ncbi:uracil permease [Bacillus sp. FJAT-44742]|uniref:uracil permease n=1 Tax=Bacillus sp. FJAT-44742 TaxID=2014005 RepID=UPI000C24B0DC|nr:uracil permease [Bacillus sp. FJAT-44742]
MEGKAIHYPLFKKQDIDAFFALFQNNLANFVIIAVTLLGMGFPASIVFGQVIPGAAVAVLAGNLYYAHSAKRLAHKEGRTDVTALSYGISTPVMFVFLFGVTLPAFTLTNDPELAWRIAVAAAFISGLIECLVSFTGKWVRKNIPRPAMLGALAGVALTFVAGEMLFATLEMPMIGILVLGIILIGFIGKVSMPFNIPSSLFAIVIGTFLAFLLGQHSAGNITEGLSNVGFYPLLPTLAAFDGMVYLFTGLVGLLAVLVPITIYNAIETMNNVEAMAVEGDEYDVRECQAVDGAGTMIGALFGGIFPTTVYIASVGSKWMGAGRGYSILNGIVYAAAAMFGLIAAMAEIIPVAVIAPILVFVGISMVSTAFQNNHTKYYPAVAIAMLPYFANYIMTNFQGDAGDVVQELSAGIIPLGEGAMFTGIVLGAVTAFITDKHFGKAAIFSLIGALLSFLGFMHASELQVAAAPDFMAGYLLLAGLFSFYYLRQEKAVQRETLDTLPSEKTKIS